MFGEGILYYIIDKLEINRKYILYNKMRNHLVN